MFISAFLPKESNLSFRRLYAHSMTIRAGESLNPKNCLILHLEIPSLKKATKGTQGLLKHIQVLDLPPSTIILE